MKRPAVLLASLALLAGCGGKASAPTTTAWPERGAGNTAVYDRIDGEGCAELHHEFDTAMDNYDRYPSQASSDYAEYALEMMRILGCPSRY